MKKSRICCILIAATILLPVLSLGAVNTNSAEADAADKVVFVASIPPLAMIINEITSSHGTVKSLLQPGSSPHVYEPKPSDIKAIETALAFFYVHSSIDGWAAGFNTANKIEVLTLIPENYILELHSQCGHHDHHHGDIDGHFWHDPITVKALLPALVEELIRLDPHGEEIYKANAIRFSHELDSLNADITLNLKDIKNRSVLLLHPAWNYYLNRYELTSVGSIEEFPGKEPSPKYIINLLKIIKQHNVNAIFSEPQLSQSAVKAIADETGLPVFMIDPLGGYEGRNTYSELVVFNTEVFIKALRGK